MRKSQLLVDQLSYPHLSISERDIQSLMSFSSGQITIRQSHMVVVLMLLQLLLALVLMSFMVAA